MIARTIVCLAAFAARLALASEGCVVPSPPPPPHCPTITVTGRICTNCVYPACAVIGTIPAGCPDPPPTTTVFSCGDGRGCAVGCQTFYVGALSTPTTKKTTTLVTVTVTRATGPTLVTGTATRATSPTLVTVTATRATSPKLVTVTVTRATSPTLPASCTFKPTQTIWATSGCPLGCDSTEFCIYDAAVTLPCGCTSVKVQPTTVTVCPVSAGCVQCQTGWGIATITESNCGGKPTLVATTLQ